MGLYNECVSAGLRTGFDPAETDQIRSRVEKELINLGKKNDRQYSF